MVALQGKGTDEKDETRLSNILEPDLLCKVAWQGDETDYMDETRPSSKSQEMDRLRQFPNISIFGN